MEAELLEEIVEYSVEKWPSVLEAAERMSKLEPFKLLVMTVLSQVTNSRNVRTAYQRLEEAVGVEPVKLASARLEVVEEALKPAGLWRGRARSIVLLAREVVERYGGSLDPLARLPTGELRKRLMQLPRVGPKTADVVLLFSYGRRVMPVDTHISRIVRRLGLVGSNRYEELRRVVEEGVRGDMAVAHLALIAFGRNVCRPRKPRCSECPVANRCPSSTTRTAHPSALR